MDRRIGIAVAVVVLAVLATAGLVATRPPSQATPHPPKPPKAMPLPRAVRISLPAPPGVERPEPPERQPPPAALTPDDRKAMNFAVDDVLRAARADCFEPWMAETPGEVEEFVFDAVLYDGQLYDVGLRAMGREIPPDVIECVADRAWYAEWPEWDLAGELRLQRTIEVSAP